MQAIQCPAEAGDAISRVLNLSRTKDCAGKGALFEWLTI
jgi:hypothetical protein